MFFTIIIQMYKTLVEQGVIAETNESSNLELKFDGIFQGREKDTYHFR